MIKEKLLVKQIFRFIKISIVTLALCVSLSVYCWALVKFILMLPGLETLHGVLAGCYILTLVYLSIVTSSGLTISRVINATIAGQICSMVNYVFPYDYDPFIAVTAMAIVLAVDLPLHKMFYYTQFALFKKQLNAATAVIGACAQTVIAMSYMETMPYAMYGLIISTVVICCGLQPYATSNIIAGPTLLHNYFYVWKNVVNDLSSNLGLFVRCLIIIVSCIGLNPIIAFADDGDDCVGYCCGWCLNWMAVDKPTVPLPEP